MSLAPAAAGATPTPRPTLAHGYGDKVEAEYASDHWDARRLASGTFRASRASRDRDVAGHCERRRLQRVGGG